MALRHSKRRNSELPVIRLTGDSLKAKKPFAPMAAHCPSLPDRELSLMFTTQELASHLRVTTRTIRRWVLDGILPGPFLIGNRSPRWLRSVIDGWFPQHKVSKRQAALRSVPTIIQRNEA
jgi:excisionase family DNA binding protein